MGPSLCSQLLNEDAVLEAIRGVLAERNRGEELVLFDAVSGLVKSLLLCS